MKPSKVCGKFSVQETEKDASFLSERSSNVLKPSRASKANSKLRVVVAILDAEKNDAHQYDTSTEEHDVPQVTEKAGQEPSQVPNPVRTVDGIMQDGAGRESAETFRPTHVSHWNMSNILDSYEDEIDVVDFDDLSDAGVSGRKEGFSKKPSSSLIGVLHRLPSKAKNISRAMFAPCFGHASSQS